MGRVSAADRYTAPRRRWRDLVNAARHRPRWRNLRAALHAGRAGPPRWRNLWYAFRPAPIPAFRGVIEDPTAGKTGICCSGGGVRSAAFNLGALQALQERDELKSADYLAAVSGGSYIAAAFTMVATCWPKHPPLPTGESVRDKDRQKAYERSRRLDSSPDLIQGVDGIAPFTQGSPEVQYLRNRSSYLAPTGTDKLYLLWRMILGVSFNVVFLATPLFAIALILGTALYSPVFSHLTGPCTKSCSAQPPLAMWILPVALVCLSAAAGLAVLVMRFCNDQRASALQVWSTRLLMLSAVVAWLTVALPAVVAAFSSTGKAPARASTSGVVGGSGLAALLAGVAAQIRETVLTPSKAIAEGSKARQWFAKASSQTRKLVASLVAALVGPALLLGVMVFATSLALVHSKHPTVNGWIILIALGLLAAFVVVYRYVDLTTWSLHPFYKRRLCTAFALRRVKPSELGPEEDGHALTRIDQDEKQGIAVERAFDELVHLSETDPGRPSEPGGPRTWPKLLVCAPATVSDPGATPPGRHVTSFTFSADEIGGPLVGGISTTDFEEAFGRNRKRQADCTLPAAVAMSGAALSPSMGKATQPALRFLLALANVRLGVWVPNPRVVAGAGSLPIRYTRPRPSYLVRELIGRNRIDAKYLYVTDGGHYENLGLVELLRRGCTRIFCIDASGGQTFKELGDAVALARSELNVEISIDPTPVTPSGADNVASACAVKGTFTYEDGTEGAFVYVRNVMTRDAPWDVKAYHMEDSSFPHDSTVDQLYTDQRFEAYRALGHGAGERALALMPRRKLGRAAHPNGDKILVGGAVTH